MNNEQRTIEEIIRRLLKEKNLAQEKINKTKRDVAGKSRLPPPSISDLLESYRRLLSFGKIKAKRQLEKLLLKRPVRTLSGVAIITVLTKPWSCPGRCIYCPKQSGMPKSYLKNEPAAQRAYLTKFDPYRQVITRLQMLYNNGHPTDKIELIVKGGSWQAYPWKYQVWFIEECFRACNEFKRTRNKEQGTIEQPSNYSIVQLLKEQRRNEKTHHRIVGLTLETRPDLITVEEIKKMRLLGCTRVELGVQHTDDKILKKIKRGHTLSDVKKAVRLLRLAGFKIDFHLMPQLPGSSPKKDYEMFKKIFSDPDLRPDMIKIYPCTVVAGSPLYNNYQRGKYHPYSTEKLIELIIKVKSKIIPLYCRISRLIRDIPATEIVAGNRVTNLREVIQAEMKKSGLECKCLRCREIGHQDTKTFKHLNNKQLFVDKYTASGGDEYFLSFEDAKRQVVYAFCRLRIDQRAMYPAFIRELHTYGQLVSLKHKNIKTIKQNDVQHQGLGKKLVAAAEKIAQENGGQKIAVISGVGVRDYYRHLGYRLENTYMVKMIK